MTAGSEEKCARCRTLGADLAVNYNAEDFVAAVRQATAGRGADVVGGDYVGRNYEAAAEDGRIVQISVQKGGRAETDFHVLMRKRLTHTGSTLRTRNVAFKATIAAALYDTVWPLFAARKLAPVIDSTFPLASAADAHRRIGGKVVLTVG